MKVCPIVPISLLGWLRDNYAHAMVLANIYQDYPAYRQFYLDNREHFSYMILDNGAAEGAQVSNRVLFDIACELRPDLVAAPDVIFEPDSSFERTMEWIHRYAEKLPPGTSPIALVQGIKLSKQAKMHSDLLKAGVTNLGYSKYLEDRCTLLDTVVGGTIHAFGLTNPLELAFMANEPKVKAVDTAIPAKWAILGQHLPYDLTNRAEECKMDDETFFEWNSEVDLNLLRYNYKVLGDLGNPEEKGL